MPDLLWLSDAELRDATRRQRPTAQAKLLRDWGVPHERRADGTLLVSRAALDAKLCHADAEKPARESASNGLNWSVRA